MIATLPTLVEIHTYWEILVQMLHICNLFLSPIASGSFSVSFNVVAEGEVNIMSFLLFDKIDGIPGFALYIMLSRDMPLLKFEFFSRSEFLV